MTLTDLKAQLSLETVLNHYGLSPDKNGRLNCPFHNDKTPSLQCYYKTGTVYCFSSNCKTHGKSMDVIDFIMYKENSTKAEAIQLAISFITTLKSIPNRPIQTPTEQMTMNEPAKIVLLTKLFQSFKHGLTNSTQAKDYLNTRGLQSDKLEIGYNSGQFHQRENKYLIESCVKYGLLTPRSDSGSQGYQTFGKHCIIFPLKNKENQIVSFYGRSVVNEDKSKHYYLKGSSGLYPGYPKAESTKLIITESIIDAASLLQYAGIRDAYSVLSAYGTNRLSAEHIEAIKELHNLKEIIFAFDNDKAGKEAAVKYSIALKKLLPDILFTALDLPCKDVNETLTAHPENTEMLFLKLLDERKTVQDNQVADLFSFSTEQPEIIPQTPETHQPEPEAEAPTHKPLNTSNPDYLTLERDDLLFTVIGGVKLFPIDKLKITLKIEQLGTNRYIRQSNFDLYSQEAVERFVRLAWEKLDTDSTTLNVYLDELTSLLEAHRKEKIEASRPKKATRKVLTQERKSELLKILKSPKLYALISSLIAQSGLIGEQKNGLITWTVYTSRLMEKPLHIIFLGASGTGKTYLQECISALIPDSDKITLTAISENALYYIGKHDFVHKLLLIEDMDGIAGVLYIIRELQTKNYVSKYITVKDASGKNNPELLEVYGPICLSATTTLERIYEDNANRCILAYLDISKEQEERILEYQRKGHANKIDKKAEQQTRELLQDLQLMFKPIKIVNPYAEQLHLPSGVFKPLRTNSHYLQFIEAVTFIHQYQREVKKDEYGEAYIETTLEDIEIANELMKDVLLSKSDELTKACRDFLEQVKGMVKASGKATFSKKDIRNVMKLNPFNLDHYLKTLMKYGYTEVVSGHKSKGYEYRIVDDQEYGTLKSGVETALDEALKRIRESKSVSS